MPSTSEWTRVILLAPPAPTPAPASGNPGLSEGLKAAFAARDWFAVILHDPHQAMAELCLRERSQTARSAWGLQRMEQLALVVLEPQTWPDLNDLVAAANRSVPFATIWQATDEDEILPLGRHSKPVERPTQTPVLARTAAGDLQAMWPSQRPTRLQPLDVPVGFELPSSPNPARHSGPPSLRLTGEMDAPLSAEIDADSANHDDALTARPSGGRTSECISREEIDMLLQMDLPDETSGVSA